MPVDVQSEILIRCPRDVVAAYAANPDNAPEWYENIMSIEWRTSPPLAIGSRIAFTAQFLGRRLSYIYEIAEFAVGQRLVMRTKQGPFPMETTYTWSLGDDGMTRMTLRNRGVPSGFSILAAPLMALGIRRANRKDLKRLKDLLEGPASHATVPPTRPEAKTKAL